MDALVLGSQLSSLQIAGQNQAFDRIKQTEEPEPSIAIANELGQEAHCLMCFAAILQKVDFEATHI